MSEEQRTRALLSPADPARAVAVPPARLSAVDLIARAEAEAAATPSRPTRRVVLAAAGAVAISAGGAAVAYPLLRGKTSGRTVPVPRGGTDPGVVVPIAYQINTDAPEAGPHLRDLAVKIEKAPCDLHSGRYVYHHRKSWGGMVQTSPEGYAMSYVEEREVWIAGDGSGRQRVRNLGVEFPDEASRRYWQSRLKQPTPTGTHKATEYDDLPAGMLGNATPLPTNRADLARMLGTGPDLTGNVSHVYQKYAVTLATRAAILLILAGLPGLLWRGQVTDRGGRVGLAVTYDDPAHGQQHLLVFDPKTGELHAEELLMVGEKVRRVDAYGLFLATDRTDQLG